MSDPKLIDALRAVLPYALSRIQDMDESANTSGAHQATERELADKASEAYRNAEALLAEYDAMPAKQPVAWHFEECGIHRFFTTDPEVARRYAVETRLTPKPLFPPATKQQQERPRIGIKVEGGVVQNVFADTEASVYVIDYDVEDGAATSGYEDEDHGVCELEQDGGDTAECVLSRYGAEVTPEWFPRMDAALAARAAVLDVEIEDTEAPGP